MLYKNGTHNFLNALRNVTQHTSQVLYSDVEEQIKLGTYSYVIFTHSPLENCCYEQYMKVSYFTKTATYIVYTLVCRQQRIG